MNAGRLKKWIKENWLPNVLTFLIVFIGTFMGFNCARRLPIKQEKVHIKDTIYIERSITDSLLLNISFQLHKFHLIDKISYVNLQIFLLVIYHQKH